MANDLSVHSGDRAPSHLYDNPPGWRALWAVSHKPVARRFLVTAFVFFVLGGLEALLLRTQLMRPEFDFLTPEQYNQVFTLHGSTMMFFFAVPVVEGLANYLLPLQLGARDLPFPRLNAFNYWCYLFGGILIYTSVVFDAVPDAGWFAYTPLSGPVYSSELRMDFWLAGVTLAEISAIGAGIELIVSVLKTRAPGMTLSRMPIFAWSMLVTAVMIVFAFTPLVVGSLLLESDRLLGTVFFDDALGGSHLLWQHFFWIFGHPEVYVMFLPAAGIVSHIVQTFSGRPLVGYPLVVGAILAVGFLSMGLWVHHMFTVGLPDVAIGFFSAASLTIAIPNGIQVFAWIATMWTGRPRFETPMLYVVAFLLTFVIGGITGVMVAVAPFDWQAHDTYFLVAHFHYVLIGGVVFPVLGGVYYWFPKITGRMMNETVGKVSAVLAFVGFNVGFFPMHWTGLMGMPRRIYTYLEGTGWETLNLWSTIGAFVLATGFALTLFNAIASYRNGDRAGDNPWGADGLEWSVTSPPPPENFSVQPVVASRHPLWTRPEEVPEEDRAPASPPPKDPGDLETMAAATSVVPQQWRVTLGTGVLDARPLELVHLGLPTFVPLLPAVGLATLGAAMLTKSPWVALAGLVVLVAGAFVWFLHSERERQQMVGDLPHDAAVRVNVSGPGGVGWWGFLLVATTLAVVLSALVFAHYYLAAQNDVWPPLLKVGYPPPWLLPTAGLLLVLVSLVPLRAALRENAEGRDSAASRASVAALVLVLAAVALDVVMLRGLDFGWYTDAYGSTFWALTVFKLLLAGVGVLGTAFLVSARARSLVPERRSYLVVNFAVFWYFLVAAFAIVYVVLHLVPLVSS